jgi:hypothetical protein
MSIRRILSVVAFAVAVAAVLVAVMTGHRWASAGRGDWNHGALRATLERVVPAHNDAFFVYQLENRTSSDYRIAGSDVQILGRRSTGDLMAATGAHVSGEFPLLVPARRKVHFALIWTADRDIEPSHMEDFVRTLNVRSFVLFDHKHRYQLEFPANE